MRDLPQPPRILPGGKVPGNLLVIENVYHSRADHQISGVESRYSRWLTSDGPSHVDEFDATQEWQPVQMGRIRVVGEMVIENLEGTDLEVVPSVQQREEIANRVVQVCFVGHSETPNRAHCKVPPGESCRFQPEEGETVYLRCKPGASKAKARVTTIPA